MGLLGIWLSTVSSFTRSTSIAGVNQAGNASSWPRSLYWMAVFSVFFALTVQGIVSVVLDYYSHPFDTNTELNHELSVEFPAVTFCNLNRINCDNLFTERVDLMASLINVTIDDGDDENDADLLSELKSKLSDLDEIFELSGCLDQICAAIASELDSSLATSLSQLATSTNLTTAELLVLTAAEVGCPFSEDAGTAEKACGLLMFALVKVENLVESAGVGFDEDAALALSARVNSSWADYGCESKYLMICKMWEDQMKMPMMKDMELPSKCDEEEDKEGPETPTPGEDPKDAVADAIDAFKPPFGKRRRKKRAASPILADPAVSSSSGMPFSPMMNSNPTTDAYNEANFVLRYLMLDVDTREKIGHRFANTVSARDTQVRGFVTACTYRGTDCTDPRLWYTYTSPAFGNCLIFNFAHNSERDPDYPREASLTGVDNGLTVELFLDQDNYMIRKLSKKAGVRVVVHDSELAPLPDEYGVDLQPNTASSISVRKDDITRLESPFKSECMDQWEDTGYDITTIMKYSLASCQRVCLQLDIISECGCFHPQLAQYKVPETQAGEPCYVVASKDNGNYTCIQDILEQFDSAERKCNCRASCKERDYTSQVTSSTWPSNQYWDELATDLGYELTSTSSPAGGDGGMPPASDKEAEVQARIQTDFVQANVYFQTLNVRSVTQKRKYTGNVILSSLGGALSLYLGMAAVLLFELLELLFDLLMDTCHYLKGGKSGRKALEAKRP